MANTIEYSYRVNNLSDPSAVTGELEKINGVVSARFEDGVLTYELDEHTDEYDILITAMNLCDSVGAELIVGEEEPVSDYDYDAVFDADDFSSEEEEVGLDIEEGFEEEKKKPVLFEPEEEKGDHIVASRKKLKTESTIRFIELAASLVLLVVALFLPENARTAFSFRNVLLIISFAIAAYEVIYTAITDVIGKRWLSETLVITVACIAGAFLGRLTETVILTLVYALTKEIGTYINGLNELRLDEAFYTGSLPVTLSGGGTKKKTELEVGDVVALEQYEILSCDGKVLSDATFDCHMIGGGLSESFAAGETVLAGSLLVSENTEVEVIATNEDSVLERKKKEFLDELDGQTAPKNPLAEKIIVLSLYLAALAVAFITPLFLGRGYVDGLLISAPIGVLIAFIANIGYYFSFAKDCFKTALILSKINAISFDGAASLKKLGSANSFVFDADALTENGEIKPDSMGALKELLGLGARNVTTDFSACELDESVRKQIDFVDKSFDGERKVAVGNGKDVSLSKDGSVAIGSGEISFVPLAYKTAKRAVKAKKTAFIFMIAGYVLSVAAAVVISIFAADFVLLGAVPALAAALFGSLLDLSVARVK